MSYLLSIVIPTKDRYYFLKQLIELIKSFDSEEIEVIVQDNTLDNQEILCYLESIDYKHLKYFYTKEQLSVSDNCSKAVHNSSGEYVCVLGDDDGLLPKVIDVVRYMKRSGIDALVSKYIIYNWPDYIDESRYKTSASILYNKGTGNYIQIEPEKEFATTVASGFRDMSTMPRVYQALVKREYLDRVYEKCGSFFPGPSPDMSNAVALSNLPVPPCTFYYDSPLIFSGQCKSVGGGERLIGKTNLKKIEDVSFLPKNVKETWDKRLPVYWCSDTVWPASAIYSFKQMTGKDLLFDNNLVIARFLYNHPAYYNECISLADRKFRVWGFWLMFMCGRIVLNVKKTCAYYLSGKKKIAIFDLIRNVNNIQEAVDILNEISDSKR